MSEGFFITLEGGEGCGKTTQATLLAEHLKQAGHEVLVTREPGGTEGAETIRALLVSGSTDWDPYTETLLHMAARREHVQKVIAPALAKNTIVICDRFMDSTLAYQGYGHGVDLDFIDYLQQNISPHIVPNLTFLLEASLEEGLARTIARQSEEARYERMGNAFHARVHAGFKAMAAEDSKRIRVVDATKPIEAVQQAILSHLPEAWQ